MLAISSAVVSGASGDLDEAGAHLRAVGVGGVEGLLDAAGEIGGGIGVAGGAERVDPGLVVVRGGVSLVADGDGVGVDAGHAGVSGR